MKKLIYAFTFIILTGTALATSNEGTLNRIADDSKEINHEFKTCHATVKGTINGVEVDIDVTFEADNCAIGTAKLIKEAAKE